MLLIFRELPPKTYSAKATFILIIPFSKIPSVAKRTQHFNHHGIYLHGSVFRTIQEKKEGTGTVIMVISYVLTKV